jgi:hypothetical protein
LPTHSLIKDIFAITSRIAAKSVLYPTSETKLGILELERQLKKVAHIYLVCRKFKITHVVAVVSIPSLCYVYFIQNQNTGVDARRLEPGISDDVLWGIMSDPLNIIGADGIPSSDGSPPTDSQIR